MNNKRPQKWLKNCQVIWLTDLFVSITYIYLPFFPDTLEQNCYSYAR